MSEENLPNAESPPPEGSAQGPVPEPTAPEPPASAQAPNRVHELENQVADRERQLHRLAADFENFRKRAAADKEELVRFAASRVLENFLPILDNFERALAHAGSGDAASILQGVELIYKQVQEFLTRQGVAAMESEGEPFDPNVHEAIGSVSTDQHPDHTVVSVAQKGYYLNGRVLRHAMVQVADNPSSVTTPTSLNDVHDTAEDPGAVGPAADGAKEESHG